MQLTQLSVRLFQLSTILLLKAIFFLISSLHRLLSVLACHHHLLQRKLSALFDLGFIVLCHCGFLLLGQNVSTSGGSIFDSCHDQHICLVIISVLIIISSGPWASQYQNISTLDYIGAQGDGGGGDDWSYIYLVIAGQISDVVFELVLAADWLSVTMETSAAPLIEMDSAIIDKGTEERLVSTGSCAFILHV